MSALSMQFVTEDCLFLVCELTTRKMQRSVSAYLRNTAMPAMTTEQCRLAQIGVTLHRRFLSGDYRATLSEVCELGACCQMVSDLWQEATGNPKRTIDYSWPKLLQSDNTLKPGAYKHVMEQIAQGACDG